MTIRVKWMVLKKALREVNKGKMKAANRMEWKSVVGAVNVGSRL
jgi:hypothetical protein